MKDEPALASLQISQVHYNPSDPLSTLFAYLSLLPQSLILTYCILFLVTREIEIALAFAGQIGNVALNVLLKRIIKGERPEVMRPLGKGYGMPSNHAQFTGFFCMYILLWFAFRRNVRAIAAGRGAGGIFFGPTSSSTRPSAPSSSFSADVQRFPKEQVKSPSTPRSSIPLDKQQQQQQQQIVSPALSFQLSHPTLLVAFLSISMISLSIIVAYSRVYMSYHTTAQVVVGTIIGAFAAIGWFVATDLLRKLGWIEWGLDLGIVRMARVRDLCCEVDLVEVGWRVWEGRRGKKVV